MAMYGSKSGQPDDVAEMLNGALKDLNDLTQHIQAALEEFKTKGSADVQAWVDKTLATLQQAQSHNQRVEWEINAAATYLRNILRQQGNGAQA